MRSQANGRLLLAALLLFANQAWGVVAGRYTVDSDTVDEASGVAVSRRNPDVLWTHNDSGSLPTLYAVTTHGHYLGQVDVRGALAIDWEDIAAFKLHGKPYLLIADTGNNFGFRPPVRLYLLPEPDISQAGEDFSLESEAVRSVDINYPDTEPDVEAVAVDALAGKIYLLSKRDNPPTLYQLPLAALATADNERSVTARPVTQIKTVASAQPPDKPTNPKIGRRRYWPSALDISADGRLWLIGTAAGGYLYTRKPGQTPAHMLAGQPTYIPVPDVRQLEAGALSPDGELAYFMSEKLPTPIVIRRIDRATR